MPIIQLPDNSAYWGAYVAALAFFPKSPQERDLWYRQVMAISANETIGRIRPNPYSPAANRRWQELFDVSRSAPSLNSPFTKTMNRQVLWCAETFLDSTLSEISLTEARANLAKSDDKLKRIAFSSAESELKRAWSRYRSTVHIVAAYTIIRGSYQISNLEDVLIWFGLSEHLRSRGEIHRHLKGQPILNPNETYRMPANISLPDVHISEWKDGKGFIAIPEATGGKVA